MMRSQRPRYGMTLPPEGIESNRAPFGGYQYSSNGNYVAQEKYSLHLPLLYCIHMAKSSALFPTLASQGSKRPTLAQMATYYTNEAYNKTQYKEKNRRKNQEKDIQSQNR